jgi:hypothetical protein
MRITRHPAQGGAPRDAALERAESGINHTRYCSACGIPSRCLGSGRSVADYTSSNTRPTLTLQKKGGVHHG